MFRQRRCRISAGRPFMWPSVISMSVQFSEVDRQSAGETMNMVNWYYATLFYDLPFSHAPALPLLTLNLVGARAHTFELERILASTTCSGASASSLAVHPYHILQKD